MPALGWFLWLLLGSSAFAADTRGAVLDLLNAYEDGPTAEQLRALGDGVGSELLAIATDASVPLSRRARAVSALQHFRSDAAVAWLAVELSTGEPILRRKAAWSLAILEGDAAIPALGAALADPDVQLRMAAAHALGGLGTPAAKVALQARLDAETDAVVRATLTQEVSR